MILSGYLHTFEKENTTNQIYLKLYLLFNLCFFLIFFQNKSHLIDECREVERGFTHKHQIHKDENISMTCFSISAIVNIRILFPPLIKYFDAQFYREVMSRPFRWTNVGPYSRKICLLENRTRQIFYLSRLNCAMNHTYNVYQFKRYIFNQRKLQFVIKRMKYKTVKADN